MQILNSRLASNTANGRKSLRLLAKFKAGVIQGDYELQCTQVATRSMRSRSHYGLQDLHPTRNTWCCCLPRRVPRPQTRLFQPESG